MINFISDNNKIGIIENLDKFKYRGIVKFENLFEIKTEDRLPALVDKMGKESIHKILIILLTDFVNSFNLVRSMTSEQIVMCAFEMIDTSYEDNLSLEDFSLFFQGAKSSNYGKVYDHLDQATIFELFENYRQLRHEKYIKIKEEKESNYKAMGDTSRSCDDATELKDLFHQANLHYLKNKQ